MVQIAGTYELVKNENFVEHLVGIGFPEDKAKAIDSAKTKVEIVIDGNKIMFNGESAGQKHTSTFVLGEEVDDVLPILNATLKSTTALAGDTLTITSKADGQSSGTRVHKFGDKELVVTLTSSDAKVPDAKRYYKRV